MLQSCKAYENLNAELGTELLVSAHVTKECVVASFNIKASQRAFRLGRPFLTAFKGTLCSAI